MAISKFVYVVYIRTTPTKLWRALTSPKIIKRYWFGLRVDSDWKVGSSWQFYDDKDLIDSGEILEIVRQKRLVRSWLCEWKPELKAEGKSHCSYEIQRCGKSVKLTVTHTMRRANSKFIKAVSEGWPMCLSNLKSLLEVGKIALADHSGHGE